MHRLLFLIPSKSYRAKPLMEAVGKLREKLDFEPIIGSDVQQSMAGLFPDRFLLLDFSDIVSSTDKILAFADLYHLEQVIAFDEEATLLANFANAKLGKKANGNESILFTKNKALMRVKLSKSDVVQPQYSYIYCTSNQDQTILTNTVSGDASDITDIVSVIKNSQPLEDLAPAAINAALEELLASANDAAHKIGFPIVVKAVGLSGSRGIIRADNEAELRVGILQAVAISCKALGAIDFKILIEQYIPGTEVAIDAFVIDGMIKTLAVFDKPDPLEGPYFEETIYITPSRYDDKTQADIIDMIQKTCQCLQITTGPIHAELRLTRKDIYQINDLLAQGSDPASLQPVLLEIATRPIGGRCGDILNFLDSMSLYEVLISLYLGYDLEPALGKGAFGAMMIPITKTGILSDITGMTDAMEIEGIADVKIDIPKGQEVIQIPEGERYLGFILAQGDRPEEVEACLRQAFDQLKITIDDGPTSDILSSLDSNGGLNNISAYIDTLLSYTDKAKCAS